VGTASRILVVDDNAANVKIFQTRLAAEGYDVVTAADGEQALAAAETHRPDLVLLDIMMPKLSGWDVCRELRRRGVDVPVIMLTARGEEVDRVRGLELGADDYVAKPFSLRELLARVRAVLRRPGPRQKFEALAFGDVRVHRRGRRVTRAGREVRMTRKEFDLLVYLLEHQGDVITRERLLDEVWGYERFPTTRTVDTHILRLRRKFEADADHPVWILTLHGHGYKFANV